MAPVPDGGIRSEFEPNMVSMQAAAAQNAPVAHHQQHSVLHAIKVCSISMLQLTAPADQTCRPGSSKGQTWAGQRLLWAV